MKASELIDRLQTQIILYGDLEVVESFSGDSKIIRKVFYDYDATYIDKPAVIVLE